MSKFISIGKIVNFHGIKGEAKVGYSVSRQDAFAKLKEVLIDGELFAIDNIRFHKNFAIVKFKGINTINQVTELKGKLISIKEEAVMSALEENEYLIKDLEGLDAYDTDNNYLGAIVSVGENKSTSLLGLKSSDDKIHLIPFIKEFVPVVDIANNKIIIKPIEGLIE